MLKLNLTEIKHVINR